MREEHACDRASSSDRAGYTTTVSFGMKRAGTYEKELLFVIIQTERVGKNEGKFRTPLEVQMCCT